ncbi:MAG: aminoglycoside 6-adenylyltransferase [Clostridiales bacterium]|nr:aminoglycoside 6-adenylyltransferase [Clostridiales bacterium]
MRTPEEMMNTILNFAKEHEDIRIVAMEGSRVNKNIPKDSFQDFDVTYFVKDIKKYTEDDRWLSAFGKIIMMQKPEDMELFPAEEEGYSYLIMFDDYRKMDLTLLEEGQFSDYLKQDKLRKILLDKSGNSHEDVIPTDEEYWIQKPTARSFDDCCNEFWNLTSYVVKGLCRQEILFAIDHLQLMRNELLRMLSWQVGTEKGFTFSVGKNYKFINQHLFREVWESLLATYRNDSYEQIWEAFFLCLSIFRECSGNVAERLEYRYPDYDGNMTKYAEHFYAESR